MRVTFTQDYENGLRDIRQTAEQLADAQRQVSSGRRIHAPSDDPAGATTAIAERASLAGVDAYRRATDAASSRLAVADAVLSDIVNQLTAAKVSAAASIGSGKSQAQLDALSADILSIRDAIQSDINARFGGAYLFSGAAGIVEPFSTLPGGGVSGYQGDSAPISVDVAGGREVPITFDGGAIMQGSDAVHVLDELTAMAAAIAAGDGDAILQGMTALDRAFDRAVNAQSGVGVALRTLENVQPQLDASRLGSLSRISHVEDANLAAAISELARAETAQQAALGAFARLGRLTLMDYIK